MMTDGGMLDNCPFCGSLAAEVHAKDGKWRVGCSYRRCIVWVAYGRKYSVRADAARRWNRRVSDGVDSVTGFHADNLISHAAGAAGGRIPAAIKEGK